MLITLFFCLLSDSPSPSHWAVLSHTSIGFWKTASYVVVCTGYNLRLGKILPEWTLHSTFSGWVWDPSPESFLCVFLMTTWPRDQVHIILSSSEKRWNQDPSLKSSIQRSLRRFFPPTFIYKILKHYEDMYIRTICNRFETISSFLLLSNSIINNFRLSTYPQKDCELDC